mmetsp:Transcript_9134/g.40196  ORF Transcript_9134/g.40196 Transcript_9134/m.40196 type:complete len:224 (-) Transcript_9134:511-1182(-)
MSVTGGLSSGSGLDAVEPRSLGGRGRVRVRLVASPLLFLLLEPFVRIDRRRIFDQLAGFARCRARSPLVLVGVTHRPLDEHVVVRDVDRVVVVQVVVEPERVRQVFPQPSLGPSDDVPLRHWRPRPERPVRDPARGLVGEHVALQHHVAVRLEHRLLDVILHAPVPAALVDGGDVRAFALCALLASHPVLQFQVARRPGMVVGRRVVRLSIVFVVFVVFAPAG